MSVDRFNNDKAEVAMQKRTEEIRAQEILEQELHEEQFNRRALIFKNIDQLMEIDKYMIKLTEAYKINHNIIRWKYLS